MPNTYRFNVSGQIDVTADTAAQARAKLRALNNSITHAVNKDVFVLAVPTTLGMIVDEHGMEVKQ